MSKKKRARPDIEPGKGSAAQAGGPQLDFAIRADIEQGRLVVDQFEEAATADAGRAPASAEAMSITPEPPPAVAEQVASVPDAAAAEADGNTDNTDIVDAADPGSIAAIATASPDADLMAADADPQAVGFAAGAEPPLASPAAAASEVPPPLSQRLRAAREAKGLSREEMARRMRVSPSVIQDIENDQWHRLGAAVYVRGHLTSYARSLGVPTIIIAHALKDFEAPVPLALTVAAQPSSAWRRHLSAATYVVLTLLLAIPVFNLVPKRGVNSPVPQVRGMDESEMTVKPLAQALVPVAGNVDAAEIVGPPSSLAMAPNPGQDAPLRDSPPPLMASMTPMAGPSYSAEAGGQHRIEMTFSQDSWLEVLDASGQRIDYGMARAGERRVHLARGPVSMIVGNANGAQLRVDGEAVDLGPFARLNVARLRLFESEPTSAAPSR